MALFSQCSSSTCQYLAILIFTKLHVYASSTKVDHLNVDTVRKCFKYHKKFLADFLRSPLALLSDCSRLLLLPEIKFEAKEIIPPARPRPDPAAESVCAEDDEAPIDDGSG